MRARMTWLEKTFALALALGTIAAGVPPIETEKRQEILQKIAAPWPITLYQLKFRDVLPRGQDLFRLKPSGGFVERPEIVAEGALDRPDYTGDWMPATGSNFSIPPFFQSMAVDLYEHPILAAHREILAAPLRLMMREYVAKSFGDEDLSKPIAVIEKLSRLEKRLKDRHEAGFDFRELASSTATFDESKDLAGKFFSARDPALLNIHLFHEPGTIKWYGQCHRLASGNLSARGAALRKSFEGGFCGDLPISSFDLEDMISFVHPLPDEYPIFGANRGGVTEAVPLSPEQLEYEESLGVRALMPEKLNELLVENVKSGGTGIMIDEASNPRDKMYSASSIWNRPVFQYAHYVLKRDLALSEVTSLFVARYGDRILEKRGDAQGATTLKKARETWHAAAQAADAAFGDLMTSEYWRRINENDLASLQPVPEHTPLATAEKNYKVAAATHRTTRDAFFKEVEKAEDALVKLPAGRKIEVQVHQLELHFPRHRLVWVKRNNPLLQGKFRYVIPTIDGTALEPTWDVLGADYPPDLARLPAPEPKNMERLEAAMRTCVSFARLEAALQAIDAAKDKDAKTLKRIVEEHQCSLSYLDIAAVAKRFAAAPKAEAMLAAAVKNCR